jgi:hypothetical protein
MRVIGSKDKKSDLDEEEQLRENAAVLIQRAWRHHSMRKTRLRSNARWKDSVVGMEKKVALIDIPWYHI